MFDTEGNVLCVIDLDTVMPSLFSSDYGDFLRTAANTVAEDSPELDKIDFRMDIFRAFTRGYLETAGSFLTPLEVSLLPYAAELFLTCSASASFGTTYQATITGNASSPNTIS